MLLYHLLVLALVCGCHALTQCTPDASGQITCSVPSGVVLIPAGKNTLGASVMDMPFVQPGDMEEPAFNFTLTHDIYMDKHAITNARFAQFMAATQRKTDAERFGWSFVFQSTVTPAVNAQTSRQLQGASWWLSVQDAFWSQPEGPSSNLSGREYHPAVHISHRDAAAFCQYNGGRLPTENEWEYAARGGKHGRLFPWGNLESHERANTWQGAFPDQNSNEDGHVFTAPVDAYGPQNAFGLYNMVGNVWQWTSSQWCSNIDPVSGAVTELEDYRPAGPGEEQLSRRPPPECLRAAVDMQTRTQIMNNVDSIEYVKKGGSFISQRDRDFRHRSSARDKSAANTSAQHIGARCVYDHLPAWAVDSNSE